MRQEIEKAISDVCKDLFSADVNVELTRPDEQFGDYATNVALQLAAQLNKNPHEIAEAIKQTFHHADIISLEIAGPGFLNIKLSDQALLKLAEGNPAKPLTGKSVVAEYSDPNPFKVLHAGHLYTTIVGDAIARLLEQAGGDIHRVNFGGDVGLHVAQAMWAIVKSLGGANPAKLEEIETTERLTWISERYVEGNGAYGTDESAKPEIIEMNKKIYQIQAQKDHDSPLAQIYWTAREWSYKGFDDLYEKLQVHKFDKYYPESETTDQGIKLVEEGLEKGIFEKSDGAVILNGEYHGLHTRVFMNSEGLPTYEAKDLGLAATKWQEFQPDVNVIITGNDIVDYMLVVLVAVKSFYPEMAERTRHLTHGMVKLAGGQKMSSRKGNILLADDILEAAAEASRKFSGQDNSDAVLAAVKYAFLKNRIGGDIIYNPEESVAIEGNSGPYIQYAHARARSILGKSTKKTGDINHLQDQERSLIRKIGEFTEVVDRSVAELMPHHVCAYLYELAQVFNSFYENNRVIGDERETTRLAMVELYANTLKKGLNLLGINAPEHM